eukprot:8681439-Heterocapsa_arctica.AAC.1
MQSACRNNAFAVIAAIVKKFTHPRLAVQVAQPTRATPRVADVASRPQAYKVKLEPLTSVKKMKQKEDEIEIKHKDFCAD